MYIFSCVFIIIIKYLMVLESNVISFARWKTLLLQVNEKKIDDRKRQWKHIRMQSGIDLSSGGKRVETFLPSTKIYIKFICNSSVNSTLVVLLGPFSALPTANIVNASA